MKRAAPLLLAGILVAVALYWSVLRLPRQRSATPMPAPETAQPAPPPTEKAPPPGAPEPTTVTLPRSDGGVRGAGNVFVRGAWGGGPGQFGRRHDPESNPEAPMALVPGGPGEVSVLDQVNRRLTRFKDGKPAGALPFPGDTVQDATATPDGRTVLLDRLADREIQIYDRDGKLANEVPLVGKGVPEGGGVTGVFADEKGIYVEREHQVLVRIADASGKSDGARDELPGRPTRDGRLLIAASLADRAAGLVTVRAYDRASGQPAWAQTVKFALPILHVLMLDSDRQGMVYLAAAIGRESEVPPFPIIDERITLVRLGAGGAVRATLDVPPIESPDEVFRPITVGDDGVVYVMVPGKDGLTVYAYRF